MTTDSGQASLLLRNHIEAFVKMGDDEWELLLPHLTLNTLHKNRFFIQEGKKGTRVGFVWFLTHAIMFIHQQNIICWAKNSIRF